MLKTLDDYDFSAATIYNLAEACIYWKIKLKKDRINRQTNYITLIGYI